MSGKVAELGWTPSGYVKRTYSPDAFAHLGIRLDDGIPNTYLPGETLSVRGSVTDGKTDTVLFLRAPSGAKESLSYGVGADGRFSYEYPLSEVGEYELVVASGMGFSTDRIERLYVLSESALQGAERVANAAFTSTGIRFERRESSDLSPLNLIDLSAFGTDALKTVRISQPGRPPLVKLGMRNVAFLPSEASRFDPEKPVTVTVDAAKSSTPFSMDAYTSDVRVFSADMPLAPSYQIERKEPVSHSLDGSKLRVVAAPISGRTPLRSDAYLILPSGGVETYRFPSETVGSDGYLKPGAARILEIPLSQTGQYVVEVMYSNGFPAYSAPVTYGTPVATLLPNEYDGTSKEVSAADAGAVSASSLRYVNALRTRAGLGRIVTDDALTRLAAFKAADMADHAYVGHDDSSGQKISGTASRAGIAVSGSIGENVAGGSVGVDFLIAGLALSGGHRANMLGDWTKMGAAAVVKDGTTYYVQVFGD